jgi:hypothetical protein
LKSATAPLFASRWNGQSWKSSSSLGRMQIKLEHLLKGPLWFLFRQIWPCSFDSWHQGWSENVCWINCRHIKTNHWISNPGGNLLVYTCSNIPTSTRSAQRQWTA